MKSLERIGYSSEPAGLAASLDWGWKSPCGLDLATMKPAPSMSFQVGDNVGDYRIVGAVGSGGAGQVFKVEHKITGRLDAMKVLLQGRELSQAPAERFQREIKLQASLNHPNIAAVHNAFWAGDELVMVRLVDGVSIDRVIAEGPMPPGNSAHRGAGAHRARARAWQRHYAPGYQAGEHHGHARGRGEADGFRPRQTAATPSSPRPGPSSDRCTTSRPSKPAGSSRRTIARISTPSAPSCTRW